MSLAPSLWSLPEDIDNALLSAMSPRQLALLERTSREGQERVARYRLRGFNFAEAIKRFVPFAHLLAFRKMLRLTGSVISGSFALAFMGRFPWHPKDLDLYVEIRHVEAVHDFLLECGYRYRPRPTQLRSFLDQLALVAAIPEHGDGYPLGSLRAAFDFVRVCDGFIMIQLMVTSVAVLEVILGFHSTAVMNVITHDTAYSLYPVETFEHCRSLKLKAASVDERTTAAYAKYSNRGWRNLGAVCRDEAGDSQREFGRRHRFVGDEMTWALKLHVYQQEVRGFDHVLHRSWALTYTRRNSVLADRPYMRVRVFRSHPVCDSAPDITGMTFACRAIREEFRRRARANCSAPIWWVEKDCAFIAKAVCVEWTGQFRRAAACKSLLAQTVRRSERIRRMLEARGRV
ncbi:hypothetical protein EV122DRAFT_215600 [Schizophyllum commune]